MISERRFTYGETIEYNFFDVFEEKKYLGMIQRDSTKIVDRLNELFDDNRQLKKLLKGDNEKFGKCWDRIYSLEKENEQLKSERKNDAKEFPALFKQNLGLKRENDKLKELIKNNVFGRYEEGSFADLEFKAIAYDDIVKLKMSYESEPKVIVICKQGKKENVISFCQMCIPFGVYYEIKEIIE